MRRLSKEENELMVADAIKNNMSNKAISEKYGILDMTLERTPIDRVVADMYAELAGGREA